MKDFVGNSRIVSEINNIITTQNIGHAYMFAGIKGIGKYTLAIEFAKSIMCENPIDGSYCGKCESCNAFNSYTDISIVQPEDDLIKVDVIRRTIDELMLKPIISNRKICIIDDADAMNESAQNALLKLLEEPPSYVTIILVTSNKEKIIKTIRSRCTIFSFNKLDNEEIKYILRKEEVDDSILNLSNGSVGKYLKLKESSYFEALKILEESMDSKDLLEINNAFAKLRQIKTLKEDIFEILDLLMIKLGSNLLDDSKKRIEKIELIEEVRSNLKRYANFDTSLDYFIVRLYEINNK